MRLCLLIILVVGFLCVSVGCTSIHADLDQAAFDQRIQQRFSMGMSKSETENELKRLSLDYRIGETIIVGLVYPQWSPLPGVNSFWETYGMHPLSFHFGDDDYLDELVYEPKHDVDHGIPLSKMEIAQ